MSKLEELIQELCPDGVEFKSIKDIAAVSIGEFVHKNLQNSDSPYPVYNGGISNTGFYEKFNRTANKIIISARGANAGFVNRIFTNFWSGNSCYTIDVTEKKLNWVFAYYWLKSKELKLLGEQQKGGIPAVSKKQIENFPIPVPPLPVQEEIVRILDKFTELIETLKAELTERKKQYEYYRDELLTFGNDVPTISISDCVLPIINIRWKDTTGKYKYIDLSSVDRDLHAITETKLIDKDSAPSRAQQLVSIDDILFGGTRPMLKRSCMVTEDYEGQVCSTGFCVLRANTKMVFPKWVYFMINSKSFYEHVEQYQKGTSYPAISDSDVKKYKIHVPSLDTQAQIVNLLEKFETFCNDLTSGLPAEIKARQKQYEYYRDKLLTFKELPGQ